jgi:hypothetical protein
MTLGHLLKLSVIQPSARSFTIATTPVLIILLRRRSNLALVLQDLAAQPVTQDGGAITMRPTTFNDLDITHQQTDAGASSTMLSTALLSN